MAILVLQHHDIGGPGRLGATLRDHGFRLDIRRPDKAGIGLGGVPRDLDNVHAIIILGGPQNVTDIAKYDWMQQEVALLQEAHAREMPIIGICLGHQMIAHALGGKVEPRAKPGVGFYPVSITVPGQTDTMVSGIPWDHPEFFSCGQEVTQLPPGATLLETSKHTKHVAYKVGIRTYGFQSHFECDKPMLEQLIDASKADMPGAGVTLSDVKVQLDQMYDTYARVASRLCVNLATYCFPLSKKLSA